MDTDHSVACIRPNIVVDISITVCWRCFGSKHPALSTMYFKLRIVYMTSQCSLSC